MQEFTADLKLRMRGVWRYAELDPNTHNNKLATYHSWFAIPFSRNERMPINVPRYLHLDLSKHVMRNISRFRLRAHTLLESWGSSVAWRWFLRMWPMSWWRWTCSERGACSLILPRPSSLWAEETVFLSVYTFFEDFSAAQPFLLQQVNNQLVHDFLSQQNNRLFLFLTELMDLFVAGRDQSAADQPNNLADGHPPL